MDIIGTPGPKNASFIFTIKDGPTVEFKFHASNDEDLNLKGIVLTDLQKKNATGSVFGWEDDPSLDYYRQSVSHVI